MRHRNKASGTSNAIPSFRFASSPAREGKLDPLNQRRVYFAMITMIVIAAIAVVLSGLIVWACCCINDVNREGHEDEFSHRE